MNIKKNIDETDGALHSASAKLNVAVFILVFSNILDISTFLPFLTIDSFVETIIGKDLTINSIGNWWQASNGDFLFSILFISILAIVIYSLDFFLILKIFQRKNWARITYLLLGIIFLFLEIFDMATDTKYLADWISMPDIIFNGVYVFSTIMRFVAVIILFSNPCKILFGSKSWVSG